MSGCRIEEEEEEEEEEERGEEREERRVALRCQVGRVEADDATANVEVAAGPMPNVRYPLCGGALKI